VADHRLSIDGMCSRYGAALERMWAERRLAVPDGGGASLDDDELLSLLDRLRDLLEALVRQQAANDRATASAADPKSDQSRSDAARAQANRIDGLITEALGDEAVRGRLYRLTALIRGRKNLRGS
jgi:hypothetical protein